MSIRFIIGRAGSGKSEFCLDEIRQKLREDALGKPMILLVPEQATFQSEYALVKTPGLNGVIRAQVLSFRRLAFRVMQEVGGTARIHIAETGKKMLLHTILQRRKEQLRLFTTSADQMGFIDKLNELYNEFKRYCITAEKLKEHFDHNQETMPLSSHGHPRSYPEDKLHDLLLVYEEYEAVLSRHYIDSEDYLTILAEQSASSDYIAHAEVWIDGFFGFTPQEYAVIGQLLQHGHRVTITLCLDRSYEAANMPYELDLFHPTAMTMIRLKELSAELGVAIEQDIVLDTQPLPRFRNRPMLGHMEQQIDRRERRNPYYPSADETGQDNEISIHSAVHRRAEVEGVAREITRLAREDRFRWRDIAITVRNIGDYEDLLATVFKDYEIPCFFDQKRSVMHHPLVEFIRSALDVINHHWRYDAIFRCVKTDLLLPLNLLQDENLLSRAELRHAMDQLENYVLAFGIQGSRWTNTKPWAYKLYSSLEEGQSASSEQEAHYLEQINRTRYWIADPLLTFQEEMKQSITVQQRVEVLFDLLEAVHVPERLETWGRESLDQGNPERAREHTAVWGSIIDMFDQMVELMGEQTLSADSFARMIETGMESIKLGLVPPSLDQVLIGNMDRSRSSNIRYSFVLGINDGILPSRVNEDGILSELEREQLSILGLELAPSSQRKLLDEQFLIYTALTTATQHLWLSYPLADEEGKSLLPSEVIHQVQAMFPTVSVDLMMGEPSATQPSAIQLGYVTHPERTLSYLVVQLRQWMHGEEIDRLWWDIYNWYCSQPEWFDKLGGVLGSLSYTNEEQALTAPTSRQLYGKHLRASVSRMERFASCPFAQFISHGLRLKERRIYRLEAPDIGQLFHAALSMVAEQLLQENLDWASLSDEQCQERAELAVDQLSPRLQNEILLSSKRYHYIAQKLKDIVGQASIVLGQHAGRSAFRPLGLEVEFGANEMLPPLRFALDHGGTMEIIGRIDRVDQAESSQGLMLRVIDYKSSRRSIQLAEIYHGLALQMLTYLDVIVTQAQQWLGQQAIPAGVLYFHVHNPMMQTNNALDEVKAEAEVFKRFKMQGLVLAEHEAVQLMDSSLDKGHSQLIPVALKTDGTFYKQSAVASKPQWNVLQKYTRQVIRQIGNEITNGNVTIEPFRMGKQVACTYCNYKPICQFDPQFAGNDYRPLPLLNSDAVWKSMEESVGDNDAAQTIG